MSDEDSDCSDDSVPGLLEERSGESDGSDSDGGQPRRTSRKRQSAAVTKAAVDEDPAVVKAKEEAPGKKQDAEKLKLSASLTLSSISAAARGEDQEVVKSAIQASKDLECAR